MILSKTLIPSDVSANTHYKYPLLMLGVYVTLLLTTVILANRLTLIGSFLEPGGIYFFPLAFPILDIMGEVYGYSYPRLFIWIGGVCELLFSISVTGVAHFPHPIYFENSEAYKIVLDPTIRFVFSSLLGTIIGEFLNIYLLAKWKIKLRGKSFIIRSIAATAVGQAALTVIVDILAYTGKIDFKHLLWMMLCGYLCKMLYTVLLTFPAWVIVKKLQQKEQVDFFDINTNFNPFSLEIENNGNRYQKINVLTK
ncbi:MAG: queuosine precursor transporter [Legionella sp.]|nr:queuosine precursor transporter [Legionella sp.]